MADGKNNVRIKFEGLCVFYCNMKDPEDHKLTVLLYDARKPGKSTPSTEQRRFFIHVPSVIFDTASLASEDQIKNLDYLSEDRAKGVWILDGDDLELEFEEEKGPSNKGVEFTKDFLELIPEINSIDTKTKWDINRELLKAEMHGDLVARISFDGGTIKAPNLPDTPFYVFPGNEQRQMAAVPFIDVETDSEYVVLNSKGNSDSWRFNIKDNPVEILIRNMPPDGFVLNDPSTPDYDFELVYKTFTPQKNMAMTMAKVAASLPVPTLVTPGKTGPKSGTRPGVACGKAAFHDK